MPGAGLQEELETARGRRQKRVEAEMMAKEIATKKSRTQMNTALEVPPRTQG